MSLAGLLAGERPVTPDPGLSVPELAELVVVGGWPGNLGRAVPDAAQANRDYLAHMRDVDIYRVAESKRDPERISRVVQSLARNIATEANISQIASDAGGADGPIARSTIYEYLDVLTRLMVLEDQPAWSTHMRSRATLRNSPKRHFVDPSLAAAALRVGVDGLLRDLNAFGFFFESLVVRDLRVHADALSARVLHYRDSDGVEVDIVIQCDDGRWGAFEVKLANGDVDGAARSLLRLAQKVDTERMGEPAVLGVVTSTGHGYTREDGVVVIPVGALGP
jgi:predicted AAA+ superfamily ATPase